MKFRTKTVLGIATIEIVLLSTLLWSVVDTVKASGTLELERHASITGHLLMASSRDAMLAEDIPTLEAIAARMTERGDVRYLRYVDAFNRPLAKAGRLPAGAPHLDKSLADVDDGVLDRKEDLLVNNRPYGHIEFGIDTGFLDQMVSGTLHRGGLVAGLEILLVGAFSIGLGLYLGRRLTELQEAGASLAKGELSYRIPVRGNDELAETARVFNKMAERLHELMRELSEREGTLREYNEASSDWYWETDAEHRYTWLSPQFEQVTGLLERDSLTRRCWDLAWDQEIDVALWQEHMEVLTTHRKFRDFRYWPRPGKLGKRWISLSGSPRYDQSGAFIGYRGNGTDITHTAEAALRLRLFSQVVEQCPVTVVVTDPQGAIEYINQGFIDTTGYSREEALGQNPRLIASGETEAAVYIEMWATITSGQTWTGELKNKRRNGEFYWENVAISPIRDDHGAISHFIAIKEEITFRKQAAELQDAINHRLEEQTAELARSNAELEQFSYVVSHDLRQPLRMVSSYVTLLERHLQGQLDEDSLEFIGFARNGAQRMDRLIVDILDYSRIGRKSQPLVRVELDGIVGESLLNLQFTAEEVGATITVQPKLPAVMGEETELVRLFQNLIGNSLKYRAAGRAPVIALTCERVGTEWRLTIRDNGIGFAAEHCDRIFGVFQRLHTQEQYEGTGIGLAICRRIVERHGGRIWAFSEPDKGTSFTFSLPAQQVAEQIPSKEASRAIVEAHP